jgi:uncharacterized protein (DUF2252 family)
MNRISPGVLSAPHQVLSPEEWRQFGRERRKLVPRSSHAEWQPPNRPDPVTILEEQAKTRVSDLVPIRHGRMAASAFAYYRGAAAPMAWDLAHLPTTDIRVQCCGDAHLVNFGMFAAPDRRLVFDINDFDETLPASFDWDVKRLAASVAVAARDNGFRDRDVRAAARRCARTYRTKMAAFAGMRFRDVWYSRIDVDEISWLFDAVQPRRAVRRRHRDIEQAVRRTSLRALGKLCHEVDGQYQIKPAPPVIVRFPVEHDPAMIKELRTAVASYLETLQADRREMLRRYYVVDFARKVVGVGSVGTEAFILLLMGERADEPLFLQLKEAQESVLAPFAGPGESRHEGERVVNGQRLMQAAGDVFLGWTSGIRADGVDSRDYYVRQLRDMKGAMNVPAMDPEQLTCYAGLCGWTLARGHARTGRASMIAGYLGTSDRFDQAIEEFSVAYASQNAADHQRLLNAIDDGRVAAVEGI